MRVKDKRQSKQGCWTNQRKLEQLLLLLSNQLSSFFLALRGAKDDVVLWLYMNLFFNDLFP